MTGTIEGAKGPDRSSMPIGPVSMATCGKSMNQSITSFSACFRRLLGVMALSVFSTCCNIAYLLYCSTE